MRADPSACRPSVVNHVLLMLLLGACAKVSAPTGGPIDQTPPRIASTQPATDQTSVATDVAIQIDFSEPMDRRTTQEAIFVAPATDFEMDWEGSATLRLKLAQGLAQDRTYVITIGTDAKDRRGNRLEASEQFAFSTGDALDTGVLMGRVVDEEGPRHGISVLAYDLEYFNGRLGHDPPAYATQTGSDGVFHFERLATTKYRLLAFDDLDKDRTLGDRELRALASGDVTIDGSDSTVAGDLYLTPPIVAPLLQQLTALDEHRLLLVFDTACDAESVDVEIDGLEVLGMHNAPTDPNRIYVITGRQSSDLTYPLRIRVGGVSVSLEGEPDAEIPGARRADTRPPQVVDIRPGEYAIEVEEFVFTFDEMMSPQLPSPGLWETNDSTRVPQGRWRWRDGLHLAYELTKPLVVGSTILEGVWTGISDRAGNELVDSIRVETLVLPEIDRPVLEAAISSSSDSARFRIVASTTKERYSFQTSGPELRVTRLVPGQYGIFGFIDVDGDAQHDPGQVKPFRAAEPFGWLGSVELKPSTTTKADLHIH